MAFVNENEENPNAPGNQGQTNQNAPVSSGGAGVGGATKPQNTPGVNVPAQPSAQLSAYLAANQPQAAEFGGKVAQKVGAQVNEAGQAIQPAVNTYTGNLYSVPTDQTVNAAVASSPSSLTAEQRAAYQKELGAAGASPNVADTFETTQGYQDAAGKVQKAVNQADLWNAGNNVSSLTAALAPFEGANATAGDRTLDSLLLSRTPQAYRQIQGAVAPAAGFQEQLATGTDAANQALHDAIATNQATTDAARASAQSYAQNLNQTLAQYLANAQGSVLDYNQNQINPLRENMANVQPKIADLQNAIDAYNALLNDPDNMGVSNPSAFTPISYGQVGQLPGVLPMPDVAQLATSGQYADLAALREIIGPDLFASLNTTVNPEQASLAGTWSPQTDAQVPNLGALLDPFTSPVNTSLVPNWQEMQTYSPLVQQSAPVSQRLKGIGDALNALLAASGQQPLVGPGGTPAETPPPPQGAVGPQNGQPGNEAWYNYMMATYPGLSGMPATYQGYLDQFNSGGFHVL